MDAAASHCGCGLHDHRRMLKRGQGKKQSGERQREKEGGREGERKGGRKACWGHRSAQPIPRALLHVTWRAFHRFCQRPHWEFTYTDTHTHTHTHKHTAYLVMVQRAAPVRTERNWINGALGAKYRKLSIRTWLRYSFFTVIFVDVNVEAQLAACACLFLSVANQSMWHYIWQKQ